MSTPETIPSFDDLALPSPLREAIRSRGLTAPTAVQALVCDPEQAGKDLLVSSRTGSGKTLAFGFLIARQILNAEGRVTRGPLPQSLIVAPTRELAVQVMREISWLFEKTGARVVSVTGGTDTREELRKLRAGCEILVATPGRLCDHLKRKSVDLKHVKVAVLDEGDEMLSLGFKEDLETILKSAPAERHTHLFSATLPSTILRLAATFQKQAKRVSAVQTGTDDKSHSDIEYLAHLFAPGDREAAVVNVLRKHDAPAAIVFCATRAGAAKLGADLGRRGFATVTISGELTQNERTRALSSIREGRARVLVATDVAARGLDLPEVGLVVHADLPNDSSGITHRSGRTGRAGRKGVSVLVCPRPDQRKAERMLVQAGVTGRWSPIPSADEIRVADRERMVAGLEADAKAILASDEGTFVDALLDRVPVRELVATLVRRMRTGLPEPASVRPLHPDARAFSAKAPIPGGARAPQGYTDRGPAAPRREAPYRPNATRSRQDAEGYGPAPSAPRPAAAARPRRDADYSTPREDTPARPRRDAIVTPSASPRGTEGAPARPRRDPEYAAPRADAAPARPRRDADPRAPRRDEAAPSSPWGAKPGAAGPRRDGSQMVWFRVNVGERQNAEARWIMPLICRRGGIEGRNVGAIKILPRSTSFEVAASIADSFERRAAAPDPQDPKIKFSRVLGVGGDDSEDGFSGPPPQPTTRTGERSKPVGSPSRPYTNKPAGASRPYPKPAGASRPYTKPAADDRPRRPGKPMAQTPEGYE